MFICFILESGIETDNSVEDLGCMPQQEQTIQISQDQSYSEVSKSEVFTQNLTEPVMTDVSNKYAVMIYWAHHDRCV